MNLWQMTRFACLGIATSVVLMSGQAEALLASVKTTGMAAAGTAYPQDALAAAFNPAGMTDIGNRWDAGFSWLNLRQRATISGNRSPLPNVNGKFNGSRTKAFYNGDFGVNKEFCLYGRTFNLGLVVYNRSFAKTTYPTNFPLLGTSHLGLEYVHEVVAPTLSFKVGCRHNFGISLNYNVQRLKVNGLQNFANPLFSSTPTAATNRGYNYSNGIGVTLGYRCQVNSKVSVGVAYTPETSMRKFNKYRGFIANHGRFNIPQRIFAGIAVRFMPNATIAFDIEHDWWREIRHLKNKLLPALFTSKLGLKDGAGFGWKNQTFYRLGLDYRFTNIPLTVRAGYRYANSPLRRSQTATNLLTQECTESFFTCGATYEFWTNSEISFFYAHGFNHKVKGKNSIPALLGGGEVDLEQSQNVLGVAVGRTF